MFRLRNRTLFSLILFSLSVSFTHAQSIPGISEPVTLEISPSAPRPNTNVSITAQTYATDLNRASITWYVNSKSFKKGTGVTEITIPSGKAGTRTVVSIDVSATDIGFTSNEISFRPADVTLAWKTDGYIPPFYRGKALLAYGSSFKVTAVPEIFATNGKRVDSKTLVYTWKKNGTVDAAQSGTGKDTFTGSQSSFVRGGDDISVEVSTASHDTIAVNRITLSPGTPEVLFYENSPLYGVIFEKNLTSPFYLAVEELTLRAEPFNISTANPLSGSISLDWNLNGTPVEEFEGKNEVTLRTTGSSGGRSIIDFNTQHKKQMLQAGKASITIIQ